MRARQETVSSMNIGIGFAAAGLVLVCGSALLGALETDSEVGLITLDPAHFHAALEELFAPAAAGAGVLSADGLIRLERVMHDGTKVKALASGKSFRQEERRLGETDSEARDWFLQAVDDLVQKEGMTCYRQDGAGVIGDEAEDRKGTTESLPQG
jgi:hypothetical protein